MIESVFMGENTKASRYRQSAHLARDRRPLAHLGRDTPEWRREHRLRQLYDMTIDAYDAMWDRQRGRCAVCSVEMVKTKAEDAKRYACVDHDHATHRVRGLVCHGCNRFLGAFEARQHLLPHIIAYLANGVLS